MPFNTTWYDADFGLLNYETYGHTSGSERVLNDHELNLFKSKTSSKKNAIYKLDSKFTILVDTHFNTKEAQSLSAALRFVSSINEFKQNLMIRFSSSLWLEAIDFSKMAVVGGCVLNALCHSPFADTREQDVNIISYADNTIDFERTIETTVNTLNKILSLASMKEVTVEKIGGSLSYKVFLPCDVQINFSWAFIGNSTNPLSHILHTFDMDICQVAFIGKIALLW